MKDPSVEAKMEAETAPTPQVAAGQRTFSVIIPCLNEEKVIGRCMEALVRQELPKDSFEVIVVDNGSTDGTLSIVRSYLPALHLTVLSKPGVNISGLRNAGAACAKGEMLAFLDSDCVPPPTWLARGTALLSAKDCGVIGGYYFNPPDSSWVARAWWDERASRTKQGRVSYIPSSNLLVSRANFAKIGGFDEKLETNEDCEFSQRASNGGLSITAFPELGVIHLGSPQTIRAFYRRERWLGASVFKVFLPNISKFPNAKAILFALYVLICIIAIVGGVVRTVATGDADLLVLSLAALLAAPLAIGVWKAFSFNKWSDLLPMVFLYLIYGIARARCLVDFGNMSGRRRAPEPRATQTAR